MRDKLVFAAGLALSIVGLSLFHIGLAIFWVGVLCLALGFADNMKKGLAG
jgi:hypothetical protein